MFLWKRNFILQSKIFRNPWQMATLACLAENHVRADRRGRRSLPVYRGNSMESGNGIRGGFGDSVEFFGKGNSRLVLKIFANTGIRLMF